MAVARELERLDAVARRDDRVPGALEPDADERQDVGVVVGDEHEAGSVHVPRIGPLPARAHPPSVVRAAARIPRVCP